MKNKTIHIVAFDVPFPADYGGVIDVFYRIKALHNLGINIILHCYEYGRGEQKELEKYTSKVYYYKRSITILKWLSKTPFIINTRDSKQLLQNLEKDDSPILFEGIHTTFHLSNSSLKKRITMVRTHNIEHDYYSSLAKQSSGLKKIFFKSEAKKLKNYESNLALADYLLAIKESDKTHLERFHSNVKLLPVSTPKSKIKEQKVTEPYLLFHGNLSVSENENGANWIIKHAYSRNIKLIIAGKEPKEQLLKLCKENDVELITNPSNEKMEQLIQSARIHVFYTDLATGVKLKLINAMNSSGHILLNNKMIEGTSFEKLFNPANTPEEFQKFIIENLDNELTAEEFNKRQSYLQENLNTENNCKLIQQLIS